jgi:hypothetical protein
MVVVVRYVADGVAIRQQIKAYTRGGSGHRLAGGGLSKLMVIIVLSGSLLT